MTKHKRKVRALSDTEEARIQAGIAADPGNPEWTAQDFQRSKPFAKAFPALAESRRGRGPQKEPTKVAISLRLSRDVVERFKDSHLAGHVTLLKGERSELAELAAELL